MFKPDGLGLDRSGHDADDVDRDFEQRRPAFEPGSSDFGFTELGIDSRSMSAHFYFCHSQRRNEMKTAAASKQTLDERDTRSLFFEPITFVDSDPFLIEPSQKDKPTLLAQF